MTSTATAIADLDPIFVTHGPTPTPTAQPFISLPTAAPIIVKTYTVAPAIIFLFLYTGIFVALCARLWKVPKIETAWRPALSGAIFAFGWFWHSNFATEWTFRLSFVHSAPGCSSNLDLHLQSLVDLRLLARALRHLRLKRSP